MYLNIYYVKSRQRKTLSTQVGPNVDKGHITVKRWEWGVGKGKWKREMRKAAKAMGLTGNVRATYFLIGSFYTGEYEGTNLDIDALYRAI